MSDETKDQLKAQIEKLNIRIRSLEGKRRELKVQYEGILRDEYYKKRMEKRGANNPPIRDYAKANHLFGSFALRDLCWANGLPCVSAEIIGRLIRDGEIKGEQYKGRWLATEAAVLEFIERENANPKSKYKDTAA